MNSRWMLVWVLLAFWLGRETSAEKEPNQPIVLVDGEWRTEIQAGRIVLSGPRGCEAKFEAGWVQENPDGEDFVYLEPRLWLAGPVEHDTDYPATAVMTVRKDAAMFMAATRHKATLDKEGKRLSLDPAAGKRSFAGISATPEMKGRLVLRDEGRITVDLPKKAAGD